MLSFHGFEIFMYNIYADKPGEYGPIAETVMNAKDGGCIFHSMHMNKSIGELISRNEDGDIEQAFRCYESDCRYAAMYGVKLLVLHLWGGPWSDKNIHVNIGQYPKLKKISDKYGLNLTIENIVCNTQKPLDHMKKLWELYPGDIKFTIDVRQSEFHKSLVETCESAFLWENDLVSHFHFSNYSGGHMDWDRLRHHTPLGQGDVDYDYLFAFLKSINYSGSITYESSFTHESDGLMAKLCDSYEFIAKGINA
ncbi:MAG: sugar phosphate isomerase/epimerase [Oscillospiraceae bacterium]|nr:sugar phosphate isomerase/epimerase [Oscillospiraceae bacterium]